MRRATGSVTDWAQDALRHSYTRSTDERAWKLEAGTWTRTRTRAGIGNLAGTLRGDVGRLDEVVWGEATAVDRFRHGYSTPTTQAVCDQVPPCMRVSSISGRPGRR